MTTVPVPLTTMPASTRPMIVMNSPMPIPMANLRSPGMASITASRKPTSTSREMITPSATITPMASGQLRWSVPTRAKATNALRPRPAASANGWRPKMPMASVATPATSAVTVSTWSKGSFSPVGSATPPRTCGLTNRM